MADVKLITGPGESSSDKEPLNVANTPEKKPCGCGCSGNCWTSKLKKLGIVFGIAFGAVALVYGLAVLFSPGKTSEE